MTALEVENLCVFAGPRRLLGPVNFSLNKGETLVVMGETGAGKSLIAQAILGTLPAALRMEGSISINEQRVDTMDIVERAALWGREITTLPQEPWLALGPLMASWKQVAETHVHVAGLSSQDAKQEAAKDLVALGIDASETRFPGQLSGGMAQRVSFAAATAGRAPILLADEPTKGLDHDRRDKVVSLLSEVPKQGGTLLAITHEAFVARALGGKTMVLRDGNLIEQGETEDVLANPQDHYTKELLTADPVYWTKPQQTSLGAPILTAQNLKIGRGGKTLIDSFDLTLHEGEKIAIVGPSGVGKSTLLDVLGGLIIPLNGTVVRADSMDRHGVQKLYQDPPAAFPRHVELGQSLRDIAKLHNMPWDYIETKLEELKLSPELLNRLPNAVSGGELQRISIIRALIVRPKILLADEPTSRLDPITQRETMDLLAMISNREKLAVVLVTHDKNMAEIWADKTVSILDGPE